MGRGRGLRRRIAQHRAQRPRDRQRGQDGQHDDADGPLVQAHTPSIPRGWRPSPISPRMSGIHSDTRLNRSALPMTETELNVIAALAIIGLSSSPNQGYRMPAAIGTPATL